MPDQAIDFRTKRLYVTGPLAQGGVVETDRGQANYLLNVLRMGDNDPVLVFNGRDGEWLARIKAGPKKSCRLTVERRTREQPEPYDLAYLFAPLKQGRLDYMVQKAVEMGAGMLQPVITEHTHVRRVNVDRIRANAIEAAEQCGILSIPQCREPVGLGELLDGWPADRAIVFCDEGMEGGGLDGLRAMGGRPLALLVGPEGGFSAAEQDRLRAMDMVTSISLGPRILRADTAAVAALAIVQATIGDWNG